MDALILKITAAVVVSLYCIAGTSSRNLYSTDKPGLKTKNVTAHYCPFSCTMGNETTCIPPPCPPPFCVHPAKHKPTDCCEFCPNGPDCSSPDGVPILFNQWRIVGGQNCTCIYPPSNATCK